VLVLRVSTENYSTCMVGYQDEATGPCRLYAPALRTLQATEGVDLEATVALPVIPPPDAGVEGYLLSNITHRALPSKSIQFQGTGLYAGVGFSASLDGDGSFRLRIPAGGYTASAFVCGHDGARVPFTATSGETLHLDILLERYGHAASSPPEGAGSSYTGSGGPPAYPACDSRTPTIGPGPGAGEQPTSRTTSSAPQPVAPQVYGGLAVADFNGGLGPYGIESESGTTTALAEAPPRDSPALAPALLALGLVGLAVRRRLR
jgi:hypothetical protein